MVLFLMYALILRGPTVRLARQGSRLGKTFASARRLLKILEREPAVTDGGPEGAVAAMPAVEPAKS